jgi:hypothetical protein
MVSSQREVTDCHRIYLEVFRVHEHVHIMI